jgi:hypothetical protein
MRIDRASWDRWAPVLYLFIIAMAVGLGIGLAVGFSNQGISGSAYLALLPAAVILIAFVVLVIISKRIGNTPKA